MPTQAEQQHAKAMGAQVVQLAQALAVELQPRLASLKQAGLDSHLDRDLGLDSLSRLELIARLERHFSVHLSEQIFSEAESPRDLLRAVLAAQAAPPLDLAKISLGPRDTTDQTPESAQTLTEVLDWHAQRHPQATHIRLCAEHGEDQVVHYGELREAALKVAAGLQQRGLQTGQSVALMLPTGMDYFRSFFGVLYAGGVPVPIYPPVRLAQLDDHMRRQAGILENAQCRFLISMPEGKQLARVLGAQLEQLKGVLVAADLDGGGSYAVPTIRPGDTAFLQYTSGSTGDPKGVILSHASLLANIRAAGQAIEASNRDVFVSWLPLYHDMGLIGAWLGSLYFGAQLVIMSPLTFLARPVRWLRAIHRYGGTLSAAPNFAYQLCLARIEEQELQGLDLSRWRIALNGAEAVSPDTIEAFSRRFSSCGFSPEAMFPVYGLAENSVGLSFPSMHRLPRIERIRREPFSRRGQAVPADAQDPAALRFVGCGHALSGHQIRVVDSAGHELPERRQGELEFRGPSATSGYFRNPDATEGLFDGEWLKTGDLAYIAEGELFITGRIKDLIIRGGRNIYPQELEEAIGGIPGIRKGRVAVFASRDQAHQTEQLVILAESREPDTAKRQELQRQINEIATELTQAPASEITVGVMGLGVLGMALARQLTALRYQVVGYRRSPGDIAGVEVFHGEEQLEAFMRRSEMLVALMPSTRETRGLVNRKTLSWLPPSSYFINAGRGDLVNEQDLVDALDEGSLAGAALDVFETEPLPHDSALWTHDKVYLTPHIASITHPPTACRYIADAINGFRQGKPWPNLVESGRGY